MLCSPGSGLCLLDISTQERPQPYLGTGPAIDPPPDLQCVLEAGTTALSRLEGDRP